MNPEEMSMVKAALTPVVQDVQDQGMWIFLPSRFLTVRLVLMFGSSHIRSVLIVVEYRNCRQILDVYLHFAIWIEQIQSKLFNGLVTNGLDGMEVTSL